MATATATRATVLLAHGALDRGMALFVQTALADAGLTAFSVDRLEPAPVFLSRLRNAVSESCAVIILLTQSTLRSQDVPIEIGMALAWERPVYVLHDGVDSNEIPAFLSQCELRPLLELHAVVAEIRANAPSLVG